MSPDDDKPTYLSQSDCQARDHIIQHYPELLDHPYLSERWRQELGPSVGPPPPIAGSDRWIPCEGSGKPTVERYAEFLCDVCGGIWGTRAPGDRTAPPIAPEHMRDPQDEEGWRSRLEPPAVVASNLSPEQTRAIAEAVSTLALADHMGDAHEAGLLLAKLLWGESGAKAYDAYTDDEPSRVEPRLSTLLAPHLPGIWDIDDEDHNDDE